MSKIEKILISQPKPAFGKSPYYDIAAQHNVNIDFRPFIQVETFSAREFRNQKINISDHTAVIFTGRKAIDHFFKLTEELRLVMPETMKYFCISEAVAVYLQKYIVYRKRKVFFGQTGKTEDMVAVINKHNKEHYFLPLAEEHKNDLIDMLEEKNINFTSGIMYRTVSDDLSDVDIQAQDMIILFSPAGVQSLNKNFPDFKQGEIKLGAFGPSTAKAVEEAGFRLDLSAPTAEAQSMTTALDLFLTKKKKK
ncbi:uroporphyrinogen-III synthase [Porphyromonas macacae]|uniref:Uroporphyrinogen-III synthase n=1 Tax=Porphyromonas macacae TaxID=28115 RepID=A0A379DJ60_9PORP|nr:uroporphyrinogen-III synthase [Porphyromonas macacae]KGO00103.1 uroporphyrinogen-III synthase [Porphyromonas macacae]SUB78027.1 uroporphyrinogen-III synthase [Porphyromonas macacae]